MTTIFCKACSWENASNAAKCEYCKSSLSGEWEADFRFIDEAELKGHVYKQESSEEGFHEMEQWENSEIIQTFKQEPEIHIEPEIVVDEQQIRLETGMKEVRTGQAQHKCSECTMCFKRKASLVAHLNADHCSSDTDSIRPILRWKSRSSFVNVTVYKCKLCDKITKDHDEHIKHVQSHTILEKTVPSGLIKCNHCNRTFSNKLDYKKHQNQHDKKTYQCDVCKAFLASMSILKQHKVRLHSGTPESHAVDKRFRCLFCGEKFSLQIEMINHKKTHTEEYKQLEETAIVQRVNGRLTYICKTCGRSSIDKTRHANHVRVHTKEKPFKCDMCGAAFTARSTLNLHLRLHSDERPFKCRICEATYRHKRNLRKHLLKHTGARPFKCQYCDKTFILNSTRVDHERLWHTGETPYQCEVCRLWFKTSYWLNLHRRSEHNIKTNSKPRVKILINKTVSSESGSSTEVAT